jgi:hypothetical protein
MKRLRILLLVFIVNLTLGIKAEGTGLVYPEKEWETKKPDEVGLDIRKR